MPSYTNDEVCESLTPLASLISKSEKAQERLTPETWQYSMLESNLNALRIAYTLMSKTTDEKVLVTTNDLEKAIHAIASMIDRTSKAQIKLPSGTAQYSLLQNRIKALSIAESFVKTAMDDNA